MRCLASFDGAFDGALTLVRWRLRWPSDGASDEPPMARPMGRPMGPWPSSDGAFDRSMGRWGLVSDGVSDARVPHSMSHRGSLCSMSRPMGPSMGRRMSLR